MGPYDPKKIEPKWQKVWEDTGLYKTPQNPGKDKYYCLVMLPYTSGDLHIGHWYNFGPGDTVARWHRMQGKNVLHPIGFDAFGLPAENAAIKNNIPPAKWTKQNITNMTKQLKQIGAIYDRDKSLATSDPEYYRWTQWLFLLLFKRKLAYRAKGIQNWCPKDKTVLANEQVVGENNACERCGTPVVKKELEQWYFKITNYAERLLKNLDKLDWPTRVKDMQRNWIGQSQGVAIGFKIDGHDDSINVFTTRADTLFGATYLVLAPEHPMVNSITAPDQQTVINNYLQKVNKETELDRVEQERPKTGVFTGAYVINPGSKAKIPVWISDYVLMGYGTGAIMGVPAHDERDYAFAVKFKLPIKRVIKGGQLPFSGEGKIIESGKYNGENSEDMRQQLIKDLASQKLAKTEVQYRLRDWLISRQRYWGTPIPIIYCDNCGTVPVPEKDLPVLLPEDVEFKPTGQSPLLSRPDFVNVTCPKCGRPARRETDTMDTFVDSAWYFLRYTNPHYTQGAFDPALVKQWLPVDHYIGGIEHAILHLLYARFMTMVLHEHGSVGFEEPFVRLSNQGIILGPDGQKMSKSRGNVVNPDDWVGQYGSDTFRCYLMFMGPYDQGGPFNPAGVPGIRRYLDRLWNLVREYLREVGRKPSPVDNQSGIEVQLSVALNRVIKKVTKDLEVLGFNTAIAAMMELSNTMYKLKAELPFAASPEIWRQNLENLVILLAPFAPHISEELWTALGYEESVHLQPWPAWDDKLLVEDLATIVVQVNGRLRTTLTLPVGSSDKETEQAARKDPRVSKYLNHKKIIKIVAVPNKLLNFVLKS